MSYQTRSSSVTLKRIAHYLSDGKYATRSEIRLFGCPTSTFKVLDDGLACLSHLGVLESHYLGESQGTTRYKLSENSWRKINDINN